MWRYTSVSLSKRHGARGVWVKSQDGADRMAIALMEWAKAEGATSMTHWWQPQGSPRAGSEYDRTAAMTPVQWESPTSLPPLGGLR